MEKLHIKDSPLVSICIPAHNAEQYIGDTLTCLSSQEYDNVEIIVVEDHSTDGTWEVLKQITNKKIHAVKAIRKGAAAARNQAFKVSKGDFIIFFDADDLISRDFIKTQVNIAVTDLNAVVVSCWGRFYDSVDGYNEDNQIIKEDLTFYDWVIRYWTSYKHTTPPGRVMIPRSLLLSSGLWNETLTLNDDFEFFTRVFLNSSVIKYNDEGIFFYRSGIGGLSSASSTAAFGSYYRSLESSLRRVEERFPSDSKIRLACSNLWQMFIYQVYPEQKPLLAKASKEIQRLGGAKIKSPASGLTKKVERILGWKLTKKLKRYLTFSKDVQIK